MLLKHSRRQNQIDSKNRLVKPKIKGSVVPPLVVNCTTMCMALHHIMRCHLVAKCATGPSKTSNMACHNGQNVALHTV